MTETTEATTSTPVEYVYVIGSSDSRLVKIGKSIDPESRLAEIQRMSPVKLNVLWTTEGGLELEGSLHRHFKHRRSHGEWFDFGTEDPVEIVRAAVEMGMWRPSVTISRPRRALEAPSRILLPVAAPTAFCTACGHPGCLHTGRLGTCDGLIDGDPALVCLCPGFAEEQFATKHA